MGLLGGAAGLLSIFGQVPGPLGQDGFLIPRRLLAPFAISLLVSEGGRPQAAGFFGWG